jgi:hypothetical protein
MRREHLVDGRPVGRQLAEVVRVSSRGGSRLERWGAGREGSSGEERSEEAPACLQAVELREKRLQRNGPVERRRAAALEQASGGSEGGGVVAIEHDGDVRAPVQELSPPHMAGLPEPHRAHGVKQEVPLHVVVGARQVHQQAPAGVIVAAQPLCEA